MKKSTIYRLIALGGVGVWTLSRIEILAPPTYRRPNRLDGDFSSIGSAVRMYTVNGGHPPTTDQGLGALVMEPVVGPKPKRWSRLMDRVPLDPWQTPYRYELLTPRATEWRWELRSAGPDGVFDTADDQASETECGRDRPAPGEGAPQEATPSF